jgi:hypothetical protein
MDLEKEKIKTKSRKLLLDGFRSVVSISKCNAIPNSTGVFTRRSQ